MALPIITVEDQTILLGTTTDFGNLFTAFDPDGDTLDFIQIRDNNNNGNSGYVTFNGVIQPPNATLTYNYSDLHLLVYHSGTEITIEQLEIRVQAAGQWSPFSSFLMYTVVDNLNRPIVSVSDMSVVQNEYVRVSESVAYNDPDGYPVTRWKVRDRNPGATSGMLNLNGVDLAPLAWHYVEVEDFADLKFFAAFSAPNLDVIDIRGYDGDLWSFVSTFNGFTTVNFNRPVVVPSEFLMGTNETVPMGDLFFVTDADNNTIKRYRFWDATPHSWSGNMLFDGIPVGANQWIEISATDLPRMQWMSAEQSFNEEVRIQAFDGAHWSNIQNIRIATNEKPVIGVANPITVKQQLEFVDISDILVKIDNGPVYTQYEVYDATTDPLSGDFRIGTSVLAAGQVHSLTAQNFFNLDFKTGVYEQRSIDELYIRAFNGTFWSDWTRHTVRTEPEYTDSLAAGSWLDFVTPGGDGTLHMTYSFMQSYPSYQSGAAPAAEFLQPWIEMRELVRRSFGRMSEVFNIVFEEVADSSNTETGQGGVFRIGTYCQANVPVAAYAFFPVPPLGSPQGGDMWFNRWHMGGPLSPPPPMTPCPSSGVPWDAWGEGTNNYAIFMHEFGHAVGLKHPWSGTPVLPPATTSGDYSMMSGGTANGEPVRGPMLYDIAALHQIYGPNQSFNGGNTTYNAAYWGGTWAVSDTIWDTGGIDTVDGSDAVTPSFVDLRPGSFLRMNGSNIAIAFGVDLENATTGSAADQLTGNDLPNTLIAGAGNDRIEGYGADDLLSGQAGNDTYVYKNYDGRDHINELAGAGRDTIEVGLFLGLNNFTDDLSFSRQGLDLIIDFTIDNDETRGEIRVEKQAYGKFRIETLNVLGQDIDLKYLFGQITQPGQQFAVTSTMGTYGLLVAPA